MRREEPITRLCQLIDSLPDNAWGRKWARHLIAHLLGVRMKSTGLTPTPERTVGQLKWDYETSDIRERMDALSEAHVDPEFLVKGALGLLRESFGEHAGIEGANQTIQSNQEAIDNLSKIREQPEAKKPIPLSDADIGQMIDRHQHAIDTAMENAAAAHETLSELERLTEELLPSDFWRSYALSRLM